ncbi:MAG: hypothetical protein R2861_00850 [Desulfobacterales bacterium]
MGNGKEILPEDLPMLNAQASIESIGYGMTLQDAIHDFKKVYSGKPPAHQRQSEQSRRGDGHPEDLFIPPDLPVRHQKITGYLS